jgi:hypothetical protein
MTADVINLATAAPATSVPQNRRQQGRYSTGKIEASRTLKNLPDGKAQAAEQHAPARTAQHEDDRELAAAQAFYLANTAQAPVEVAVLMGRLTLDQLLNLLQQRGFEGAFLAQTVKAMVQQREKQG